MEKIHKFKKEVLTLKIFSMINYYPGNPYYIGKDRDEEFKENVANSTFEEHKGHLEKSDFTLFKEVMTNDEVNHYYVGFMSDATLNSMYDDARFAIGSLTLEKLKYELQILDSYNYKELVEELDQLSLKFNRGSTDKGDVYRFKANIKKHFKYDLGHTGKITTTFVGCLKSELKKRTKYLEALKEDINKMIDILMESVEPLPSKTHPAKKELRLSNNVEPLKNKIMEIDFNWIFRTAMDYVEDPEEMKAFCIREQKKADRDYFYKREDFYKGFLKIVADKKELAKYQPGPSPTHIGSFFIAGGGGSGYNNESIELLEKVINEICKEDETPIVKHNNYQKADEKPPIQDAIVTAPSLNDRLEKKNKEKAIDIEKLSQYFYPSFLGSNESKANYLIENLVSDVNTLKNGKQVGQLALMIYESKQINKLKPKTFSEWYQIFCECTGNEKMTYKKRNLKTPREDFINAFYYLIPKETE